jgi:hypothetical protein
MNLLRFLLILLLVPAAACSPNSLDGSIGDFLALDFDRVKLKKQDNFLVAEYIRDTLRGAEKVCKISVDTSSLDLPDGGSYQIEEDAFESNVEIQRTTFELDGFPEIDMGRLRFDYIDFKDGGSVDADFLVVFVDSHTLRGLFAGVLEDVSF